MLTACRVLGLIMALTWHGIRTTIGVQTSVNIDRYVVCPDGWYQYADKTAHGATVSATRRISCLKYFAQLKSYPDALKQCRSLGAQLVNVNQTSIQLLTSAVVSAGATRNSSCGGSFIEKGSIQSPNYPQNYPDDVTCKWKISAANGLSLLMIKSFFKVECCWDTLVADSNQLPMRLDNSGRPDHLLGTDANLTFSTDNSITAPGFNIYFYSINPFRACGGTLQYNGWLASPNYPGVYSNNLLCQWTIVPEARRSLLLQFLAVDMEEGFDFIKVYREPSIAEVSVTSAGLDILSQYQTRVNMVTDADVQKNGFVMKYSSVTVDYRQALRGSGTFSSPGYPTSMYPSNAVVIYTLFAVDGYALLINFTDVSLEACCDKINVYSGPNLTTSTLVQTLRDVKKASVLVRNTTAVVVFSSDSTVERRGFEASFFTFHQISISDSNSEGDPVFWTGLHKENEKFYWDAIRPVLDTSYYSSCGSASTRSYSWTCMDPKESACASGRLGGITSGAPSVLFSTIPCDLQLPYVCSFDVSSQDTLSVADESLGQPWQYNALTESCYAFSSDVKNFTEATKACGAASSSLAVPRSSIEVAVMINILPATLQAMTSVDNNTFQLANFAQSLPFNTEYCPVPLVAFMGLRLWSALTDALRLATQCKGTFPYVCKKDCRRYTNSSESPRLSLEQHSVLICLAPTRDNKSVFWTRNGYYMQEPAAPRNSTSLAVSGPQALYRCGVISDSDDNQRVWSNVVLAPDTRDTTSVYRIIAAVNVPYDNTILKYLYYDNINDGIMTTAISYIRILKALIRAFTVYGPISVEVDGLRPLSEANSTEVYLLVALQRPSSSSSSTTTGFQRNDSALLEVFRSDIESLVNSSGVLVSAPLIVRSPFYCFPTQTYVSSLGSWVVLPQTPAGEQVVISNCCRVMCSGNFSVGAYWGPVLTGITVSCNASTSAPALATTKLTLTTEAEAIVDRELHNLTQSEISSENVQSVGETISRLTITSERLTASNVANIEVVISRMAQLLNGGNMSQVLYPVPSLIGKVIGNLMDADASLLNTTQNSSKTSFQASLESSLLALTEAASRNGSAIDKNFLTLKEKNVAFQIVLEPSVAGLSIGSASSLSEAALEQLFVNNSSAAASLHGGTTVRLSPTAASGPKTFLVYNNAKLFKGSASLQPDGRVISAQLAERPSQHTPELVTLVFGGLSQVKTGTRRTCGFWNFTLGDWSSAGCSATMNNGTVTCICDHLTNFAALLDISEQGGTTVDATNELVLNVISYVGLGISIICLSAIVLSFLALRKMRRTVSQKVLFHLSLSLLSLDIVFIAGVDRTDSRGGCIAVAALLHYFLLTSFMWMLVESILQYLRFVKVLGTYIPKFIEKTAIPAWGVPAVIVAIICGIDLEYYKGGDTYCFAKVVIIYYAVLLPIGIILAINMVMFIIVLRNVCCRKRKLIHHSKHSEKNLALLHAQAGIAICVVLGLTWIFGFLTAIQGARLIFQYLFCILNSLQGFLIFIFHCVREKALRDEWKKICCGIQPSTQRSTISTGDNSTTSMSLSSATTTADISKSSFQFDSILPSHQGSYDIPN